MDLIYCAALDGVYCCISEKVGWSIGFRSCTPPLCKKHKITFIDQEFHAFKAAHEEKDTFSLKRLWQEHKEQVVLWEPKYATIPDIFDERGLELALKMAEDIEDYCEYQILIPKYDCIADIPEKYVLGYSIPTTYGGTPIDIKRFAGRKVHLLGGAPQNQYTYWKLIEDDVISLDGNMHLKLAKVGQFWTPVVMDSVSLEEIQHHFGGPVKNPMILAFALSATLIRTFWVGVSSGEVDPSLGELPLFEGLFGVQ